MRAAEAAGGLGRAPLAERVMGSCGNSRVPWARGIDAALVGWVRQGVGAVRFPLSG